MAPPKKMTLQEFFSDESYGGSWADDDIDMASISVPIERPSHFHSLYLGGSFYSGSGNFSRGGGNDPGPPYIVKLVNLPVTASDSFVEDLFRSRYTSFVKFKIVADPSSNILETHIIKKVAFVELESFSDLQKVLKWLDLYYKANRKVIVEPADFGDFQHCINFNKEKAQEIEQIEREFLSNKQLGRGFPDDEPHPRHAFPKSPLRSHQPLHSAPPLRRPSLGNDHLSNAPPLVAPKNKPNPFGTAKPVDVLAKQQEIEKKLINLNGTTAQTLGPDGEAVDIEGAIKKFHEAAHPRRTSFNSPRRPSQSSPRRQSVSILKRTEKEEEEQEEPKPKVVAVPPPSVYGSNGTTGGKSLAELLSSKPSDFKESTPGARNSPATTKTPIVKPQVNKPVILKKKITSPPLAKADVVEKPEEISKEEELEIEDKLKKINESLSHTEISQPVPASLLETGEKKAVEEAKPARPVDDDRPDFKKHLNELVKKPFVPKEKRHPPAGNNYRGNYPNNRRNHLPQKVENEKSEYDEKRSRNLSRSPTKSKNKVYTKSNGLAVPEGKPNGNGRRRENKGKDTSTERGLINEKEPKEKESIEKEPKEREFKERGPKERVPKERVFKERELTQDKVALKEKADVNKEAVENKVRVNGKAEHSKDGEVEATQPSDENARDGSKSRGRGRGGIRRRGTRGRRGRGRGSPSLNLHYVRPKPETNEAAN